MSQGDRVEKTIPAIAIVVLFLTGCMLCILAIWLSGDQGPQRVASSYEASKYSVSAQNRINTACLGLEGSGLAECVIEIDQSERENHNTQKDIRAQRYMAVWGFVMAYAAIGTLGVTTIGLVWIKATLDQTREAVRAADDAVKVTREIGEAQARAYLSVFELLVSVQDNVPNVVVRLQNSGQSPARHPSVIVSVRRPDKTGLLNTMVWSSVAILSDVRTGEVRDRKIGPPQENVKSGMAMLPADTDTIDVSVELRYKTVFSSLPLQVENFEFLGKVDNRTDSPAKPIWARMNIAPTTQHLKDFGDRISREEFIERTGIDPETGKPVK